MSSSKPNRRRERPGSRGSNPEPAWIGPAAWRLPSGKALAEFALQSGFLAPVLLDGFSFLQSTPVAGWESRAAGRPGLVEDRTAEYVR
jgi:hypothetical protein